MVRCALIERVTTRRTRFRLDGDLLVRASVPLPGPERLGTGHTLSGTAHASLSRLLATAHAAGLLRPAGPRAPV